jgi:hypothetical protein
MLQGYGPVLLAAAFAKVLYTREGYGPPSSVTMRVVSLLHAFVKAS